MITNDKLLEMIDGGERLDVAFINGQDVAFTDRLLHEALVAMANVGGGYVIVGVEPDGTISGINESHGWQIDLRRLTADIAKHTMPALRVDIQPLEHDELILLVLKVPKGHTVVGTRDGVYKKRGFDEAGNLTALPYLPEDITCDVTGHVRDDYSGQKIEELHIDAFDELEIERLFSLIRQNSEHHSRLTELGRTEALKILGVLKEWQNELVPSIAGLLLVGRQQLIKQFLPCHHVVFQCYDRNGEQVRKVIEEPLLNCLEIITDYFRVRNDVAVKRYKDQAEEFPDYDEAAFMEIVINALVHRDYTVSDPITIQWFEDYIKVCSPGGVPAGITVGTVLSRLSKPVNPALAMVMKQAKLVGLNGKGGLKVVNGQLTYGRPLADFSETTNDTVRVKLYRFPIKLEFYGFWQNHINTGHPEPDGDQRFILCQLAKGECTVRDLAAALQATSDEMVAAVERLASWGYVQVADEQVELSPECRALLTEFSRRYASEEGERLESRSSADMITTQKNNQIISPQVLVHPGSSERYLIHSTRKRVAEIVAILREAPASGRRQIADMLGDITEDGVKYYLKKMKQLGIIERVGPAKGGYWHIVE